MVKVKKVVCFNEFIIDCTDRLRRSLNRQVNVGFMYPTLLLILCALMGCARGPLSRSGQDRESINGIKLSRVYLAERWQTIAAIDQRGPLTALIATPEDFEHFQIPSGRWVRGAVIDQLDLSTHHNLLGREQTSPLPLSLDGLHRELKMSFTRLDPDYDRSLPRLYDLILPAQELFGTNLFGALCTSLEGSLRQVENTNVRSGRQCLEMGPQKLALYKARPWVMRYALLWDPSEAYDDFIVADRVDLRDVIEIRWRPVEIALPTDLWIVVGPRLGSKKKISLIAAHFRQPSAHIPSLNPPKTTVKTPKEERADTLQRMIRCPPRSPCPLALVDVIRRTQKCHSDLCVENLRMRVEKDDSERSPVDQN